MTPTLTPEDAKAYITAHDNRVKLLDRMSAAMLRDVHRRALSAAGLVLVCGGPVSGDEFISAVVEIEYPEITDAREVYAQSVADTRLDAITEALQSLPLEARVPGHGHAGMSGLAKADLLALINDED
jgi:hypothetical protein